MNTSKKKRIPFWELWREVLINYSTRNQSERGVPRQYNLYAGTNAMYSGLDNVVYLYTIDGYPGSIPIDFRKEIRSLSRGNVRISFISPLEPTTIDWNSASIKSKLNTWKQSESEGKAVDEYNFHQHQGRLLNQHRRSESLIYLSDAVNKRGSRLFVHRSLMLISGTRGPVFDDVVESFNSRMATWGITATRVDTQIEQYLKSFSPFTMEMQESVRKEVGNSTVTDELAARFISYVHGKVGSGSFYMGTDIHSESPVLKEFKRTSQDAENFLVTAETGGGKSFYVKVLSLQFLANDLYNGTIMDIEGDEYSPIANFLTNVGEEVVTLNMSEGIGLYFDPLEIYQTGDSDLDASMYSDAVMTAKNIYNAVVGTDSFEGTMKSWVDTIITALINEIYYTRGVFQADPGSWKYSAGANLHEGYEHLVTIRRKFESGEKGDTDNQEALLSLLRDNNKQLIEALSIVYMRLRQYFASPDAGGTQSYVFSKRIRLEDVSTAKLVVCSFGMKGKTDKSVDTTQMALAQIYAARIAHLRSLFSKSSGMYNFKVWEEFQRWGQFHGSASTINTALTGGRKLGDVNIICTNRLQELLDNDRMGILDNLTSYAVGGLAKEETAAIFAEKFNITPFLGELSNISKIVESKSRHGLVEDDIEDESGTADSHGSRSPYKNAFLVNLDRTDIAVVKMDIPDYISDSDLLKTGVNISK